ncbi:aldo/keto reductase [Leptolyngbya sp. FACHB-261]|uniref:aldo/keto reductase n=1 Tax=Leptolyngbya sp. FACHB-261 TaxID=2692806 RepID=UPI001682983C|nr:aldo/keto reductase [Leptolyngbya sp. FACHB-261]MBD2103523.1 aldo/keto reductase [Leptolyngbya sp. FACHB-261]
MRYKLLGKSGLRISEICLGTMTFGEEVDWGASREESRKIFDAFIEAGGNFIDTANEIYTGGSSEKYLGEFIAADRERVVLATKYTDSPPTKDPNRAGNHRKSMVQSVERSLKRLNTDYIDLLWLHAWDFTTPVEEVMRAFDDLVRAGKVLYIGVSDAPAWIISQANMLAQLRGWTSFIGLQIEYNLIERTSERELLPMARALGLGVTAWSPLASGLLTGKYNQNASTQNASTGSSSESKRLEQAQFTELSERNLGIAAAVQQVAQEIGKSPAQVALNWVRQKKIIPIIGGRKLSQVKDNLACLDFELADAHLKSLDEASQIQLGFPHDFLARTRGATFGGMFEAIDNHHL